MRARKCKLVLEYCNNNHRVIGRGEHPNPTEEAVIELLKIRPIHITRWLNMVAYNKIDPAPGDRPTFARANTLLAHKKNISFYMPRRRETWDFHAPNGGKGNPTMSTMVSKLIQRVKTAEIKDHGAKARDSRALTEEEFMNVIDESRKKVLPRDRDLHNFAHPAFLLTQFHLDGRLDDIALLDTNELRPCFTN